MLCINIYKAFHGKKVSEECTYLCMKQFVMQNTCELVILDFWQYNFFLSSQFYVKLYSGIRYNQQEN